jgi:hypothetical protein
MNSLSSIKHRFFVFNFLLAICLNSQARDNDRLDLLENEIKDLKARLSNLEKYEQNKSATSKPTASNDGWKSLANWRTLKRGMSYQEIRSLLGEPIRVDGGFFTRWFYQNRGYVVFYEDKVDSWQEPR